MELDFISSKYTYFFENHLLMGKIQLYWLVGLNEIICRPLLLLIIESDYSALQIASGKLRFLPLCFSVSLKCEHLLSFSICVNSSIRNYSL